MDKEYEEEVAVCNKVGKWDRQDDAICRSGKGVRGVVQVCRCEMGHDQDRCEGWLRYAGASWAMIKTGAGWGARLQVQKEV